ncbi:MAG: hypothetical protein Q8O67_05465 [Deltaproteobacteria bacterium]|nr:hypothetical protein [Deltaproteobacteria bacterium]
MRLALALIVSLTALAAIAADPPASARGPMSFMAAAPAAAIVVEDVDGGVRIAFRAADPKEVEALRQWARHLTAHFEQGCPMGEMAKGSGPRKVCPNFGAARSAP